MHFLHGVEVVEQRIGVDMLGDEEGVPRVVHLHEALACGRGGQQTPVLGSKKRRDVQCELQCYRVTVLRCYGVTVSGLSGRHG